MSEPALELPIETPEPTEPPAPRPLSWLVRAVCRLVFSSVQIRPAAIDRIRDLSRRGTVVYVLRQRSWVDYLLVTYVLEREGVPAPSFANDMRALWMRPLSSIARGLWQSFSQLRPRSRELWGFVDREHCRELVQSGHSALLFLRGRKPRWRFGKRRRLLGHHHGRDYIREIVHHCWSTDEEVFFVPLAPLRGRGMRRKESRLAALVYSLRETPSQVRRIASLLWNRHDTSISAGGEVSLRDFVRRYRREGEERTVRRLARELQIYLYREERVVWGPLLLPKRQVCALVLGTADVESTIARLAAEGKESEAQLRRRAGRYIQEMAADFKKAYFSVLEVGFNRIWPRMFTGLEYSGLERVVECVKQHPVVLVPSHRSHFDYVILSYLFHLNYLSPPHIAAGLNLSFWPMGPLFRGAGAYFIRRTFEGNELYKAVFRQYLTFLIREGYTQEFFIEGGRSRTGKVLPPKLGILTGIVDAFCRGARKDLYFVPVSIHYGRVAEEDAYRHELGGAEKQPESFKGLLQARRVLGRRHGTAYVSFAEPVSLSDALGDQRTHFGSAGAEAEGDKRVFVRKLGLRLLREINDASVVGATSVSATVLMSARGDACRTDELVGRARALVAFLRRRGVRLTGSLERNDGDEFRESLAFLESGGLVSRLEGMSGDAVHVAPEKRLALDFYKNNAIHCFLLASLLLDAMQRGLAGAQADADVEWWLDLLRWEFPFPDRSALAAELAEVREILRAEGAIEAGGDVVIDGHPLPVTLHHVLDPFREAYWVVAKVLLDLEEQGASRKEVFARSSQYHATGLLLGELAKPEGSSAALFGNAVRRFGEIGIVDVGDERDPSIVRGQSHDDLGAIEARIAESVACRSDRVAR